MKKTILLGSMIAIALFLNNMVGHATEKQYLFEYNQKQFSEQIQSIGSRSFKFLVSPRPKQYEPNSTQTEIQKAEEIILFYRSVMIRVANAKGYDFISGKKDSVFKSEAKFFFDTKNNDLDKNGFVIRHNYPFDKKSPQSLENKFQLTVKQMSVKNPLPVLNSALQSSSVIKDKKKIEENISVLNTGKLQSYFEITFSSKITQEALGSETIANYAKFYPIFKQLGIEENTVLEAQPVYSLQIKPGYFLLPSGEKISFSIESWSTTPNGFPLVLELSFDSGGYTSSSEKLKAVEDFFLQAVVQDMQDYALSNSDSLMGSKLRVLKHAKQVE